MKDTTNQYFLGVVKLNYQIQVERGELAPLVFVPSYIVFIFALAVLIYVVWYEPASSENEYDALRQARYATTDISVDNNYDDLAVTDTNTGGSKVLASMAELYSMNNDMIGWLTIDGTVIDYPVMQTMDDEEYYLERGFDGEYNSSGCLLMDTDSRVGDGTKSNDYSDGSEPNTNLIIHGHNMKNGTMFGSLDKFKTKSYTVEHSTVKFTTLYEEREYEIMSVFLSQVYLKTQTDVFKYYNFFQADTEEEFDDFYNNVKKLALFDTGVTAEFGDEFITLSACAYHVENGRLVVVAKRVK